MKLSIIVPTYNSEKTISRCLDSIIGQLFQDWELLVIDGVSKDGTVEIVKQYSSLDSRIRIFSEPDNGIYDAMNKGIDRSQGEWLYFLGSDDFLYDLHSLEGIFNNNVEKYDVVYGTVVAPHYKSRYKGEWKIENYMDNRCHQAIFYKRSFFGKRVRYNTRYKVCADSAINMMWFLSPKYTSRYYPVVVAHHSAGGYSSSMADNKYEKDQAEIILKYGHSVLPIKEKKKMARLYIYLNPEKKAKNFILKIYILYLRLIAKL